MKQLEDALEKAKEELTDKDDNIKVTPIVSAEVVLINGLFF